MARRRTNGRRNGDRLVGTILDGLRRFWRRLWYGPRG